MYIVKNEPEIRQTTTAGGERTTLREEVTGRLTVKQVPQRVKRQTK